MIRPQGPRTDRLRGHTDTILAWYRKLVARKFDGSKQRTALGRPRIGRELKDLVVQLAQSNSGWGYDQIVGALANLGYSFSAQTVGNILRRRGIPPTTERRKNTTWKDFIRRKLGIPPKPALPAPRSGHEILPGFSKHAEGRWRGATQTTRDKSQSECLRRTLGPIRQRGMLLENGAARRKLFVPSSQPIHNTLP